MSEAAPCRASWNDCEVGGNCGKWAGTTGAGRLDVCSGIEGGGTWRGCCTRHASAGHGNLGVLGTGSTCMRACACGNVSIV